MKRFITILLCISLIFSLAAINAHAIALTSALTLGTVAIGLLAAWGITYADISADNVAAFGQTLLDDLPEISDRVPGIGIAGSAFSIPGQVAESLLGWVHSRFTSGQTSPIYKPVGGSSITLYNRNGTPYILSSDIPVRSITAYHANGGYAALDVSCNNYCNVSIITRLPGETSTSLNVFQQPLVPGLTISSNFRVAPVVVGTTLCFNLYGVNNNPDSFIVYNTHKSMSELFGANLIFSVSSGEGVVLNPGSDSDWNPDALLPPIGTYAPAGSSSVPNVRLNTGTVTGTQTLDEAINSTVGTMEQSAIRPTVTTASDSGTGSLTPNLQSIGLQNIFPFCIPFDLVAMFTALDRAREAPHWEIILPLSQINDQIEDYNFVIDFSGEAWERLASVVRTVELFAFGVALALGTRQLIRG